MISPGSMSHAPKMFHLGPVHFWQGPNAAHGSVQFCMACSVSTEFYWQCRTLSPTSHDHWIKENLYKAASVLFLPFSLPGTGWKHTGFPGSVPKGVGLKREGKATAVLKSHCESLHLVAKDRIIQAVPQSKGNHWRPLIMKTIDWDWISSFCLV